MVCSSIPGGWTRHSIYVFPCTCFATQIWSLYLTPQVIAQLTLTEPPPTGTVLLNIEPNTVLTRTRHVPVCLNSLVHTDYSVRPANINSTAYIGF